MMDEVTLTDDGNDNSLDSIKSEFLHAPLVTSDGCIHTCAIILQSTTGNSPSRFARQSSYVEEVESDHRVEFLSPQQRISTASYHRLDDSVVLQNPQKQIVGYFCQDRRCISIVVLLVALVLMCGVLAFAVMTNTDFVQYTARTSTIRPNKDNPVATGIDNVTPRVLTSTYSLLLTTKSPTYCRSKSLVPDDEDKFIENNYPEVFEDDNENDKVYYYEISHVNVQMTGNYTIGSDSTINTYGYIYRNSFDPANPSQNLLTEDNDSGGNEQFKLTYFLWPKTTYILVTTTFSENVTGTVLITAFGPGFVDFTVLATTLTSSTTTTTQTRTPSSVTSRYPTMLTSDSQIYCRTSCSVYNYYYYEAIEVHVNKDGAYTLTSSSSFDTYGCIYNSSFDPFDSSRNLLLLNDDSGGSPQFQLDLYLRTEDTYILVVTTYAAMVMGDVVIIGSGPATISFTRSTTHQPSTTTTSTITTEATTSWSVASTYSSAWTSDSPMYCRTGCLLPSYYYTTMKVSVSMAQRYSIVSKSTIDTYGYIYNNSFDPSNPSRNLLAQDDDSGGNKQFKLAHFLQPDSTYVLVATTFNPYVTGQFWISGSGPGSIIFHS